MDKDRIKGKIDDVKGRVKRQTGEWTGDENLQAEGTADQVKGKAENLVGKVKDAGRDAADKARDEMDRLRGRADREAEEDRDRKVA